MTDDELDLIAERHLDGLSPRSDEEAQVYAALDRVVEELRALRQRSGPELPSDPLASTRSAQQRRTSSALHPKAGAELAARAVHRSTARGWRQAATARLPSGRASAHH